MPLIGEGLPLVDDVFQVLREAGGAMIDCGRSASRLLLRRKGLLLKKPLRFFWTAFMGLKSGMFCSIDCLTGDIRFVGGSTLDNEVGFEYSLVESWLPGRIGLC